MRSLPTSPTCNNVDNADQRFDEYSSPLLASSSINMRLHMKPRVLHVKFNTPGKL